MHNMEDCKSLITVKFSIRRPSHLNSTFFLQLSKSLRLSRHFSKMRVPQALVLGLFSALSLLEFAVADNSTYDYIVVGSGPGGGTLASNLAKGGASVLLLEAGDDQGENPHQKIAGLFNLVGVSNFTF